ncbi:MAG: hypothetical protein L0Z50_31260, partial [Verrucomicrobiales bacterium]|nr:hypothetical protein [Verrucomicrobiales bacterium]
MINFRKLQLSRMCLGGTRQGVSKTRAIGICWIGVFLSTASLDAAVTNQVKWSYADLRDLLVSARQIAQQSEWPAARFLTLKNIALIQIKNRDQEEASNTFDALRQSVDEEKDLKRKDVMLTMLAELFVKAQQYQNARTIAMSVRDPGRRNFELREIAMLQVELGDVTEAVKTAKIIEKHDVLGPSYTLKSIAVAQASKGDFPGARQTANAIERDDVNHRVALRRIATAEAVATAKAGNIGDALRAAATLSDCDEALQEIANLQAAKGDIPGARDTLVRTKPGLGRDHALERTVMTLLAGNNREGAKVLLKDIQHAFSASRARNSIATAELKAELKNANLDSALDIGHRFEGTLGIGALWLVADAQIHAKRFVAAIETLEEMDRKDRKLRAGGFDASNSDERAFGLPGVGGFDWRRLAQAQAESGDEAAAAKTLEHVSNSDERAFGMDTIAVDYVAGQAKMGFFDKAITRARSITN